MTFAAPCPPRSRPRCRVNSRSSPNAARTFFDPAINRLQLYPRHSADRRKPQTLYVQLQCQTLHFLRRVGTLCVRYEVVQTLSASIGLLAARASMLGQPVGAAARTLHIVSVCPLSSHLYTYTTQDLHSADISLSSIPTHVENTRPLTHATYWHWRTTRPLKTLP